jgi:ABC-type lipoprotein release transport system permease subunit
VVSWDLYETARHTMADFGFGMQVQLADPSRVEEFSAAVQELTQAESDPAEGPQELFFGPPDFSARFSALRAPVRVETGMLWALAGLAAVSGVVVVCLLMRVERRAQGGDRATLAMLGFGRLQFGLLGLLRALPPAVGGGVVAVVLAVLLSARFPVGTGRRVEPDPGTQAPALALAGGALATVFTVVALAWLVEVVGADHAARSRARHRPRSRGISALPPLPMAAWLGRRFAFGAPSGRSRRTTWFPLAGAAVALGALVAVSVVGAGLADLYEDDARHGFPWDVAIGNVNFELQDDLRERVVAEPVVATAAVAQYGDVSVDGEAAELLVVDTASPEGRAATMVEGRPPRGEGEIALGAAVLEAVGARLGDVVTMSLAGSEFDTGASPLRDVRLRVVGVTVGPMFGEADLGGHALVDEPAAEATGVRLAPQLLLVSLRPDVARAAAVAELEATYPELVTTDTVPARIASLWQARRLPVLGAFVLAGLGGLLTVFTLVSLERLRGHDVAVLRSVGSDRRSLRRVSSWQAAVLGAAVAALGLPVGLVSGVGVWRASTSWLGVPGGVDLPVRVLLGPPLTLVLLWALVQLAATGPRRARLAEALRSE